MLPLLITGAVAAGALLWYFFGRKKKKDEPPPPPSESSPGDEPAQPSEELEVHAEEVSVREKNAEAVDRIVKRLQFAVGQVIHKSVKVGEETRPSIVPTDDLTIRPMNGIDEVGRVLSSAHALSDDLFYAGVAAKQLPVVEYTEQFDVTADVEEPSRKIVVILQDMSDSMKESHRMDWALTLDKRIIAKASAEKAEVAFLPFGPYPDRWLFARTDEERANLKANLESRLHFMGGTNIDLALAHGIEFVSDPSFTERKIVLVTDGTQAVSTSALLASLKAAGAELHTVCIGPQNPDLESISAHYDYLLDEA